MKKILRDLEGNILLARVIKGIPDIYEDITDLVVNPEKTLEVSVEHLTTQTVPAVEGNPGSNAYWSNGEHVVFDSNDIPTVEDEEGNAMLDPSYVKTEAVEAVEAQPERLRLIKKVGTDDAIILAEKKAILVAARAFGDQLITDFGAENMVMGITQDGMTNHVRKVMSEITNALITGSLKDAIDEIDEIAEEDKDEKYITDARLQQFKTKILNFLGA